MRVSGRVGAALVLLALTGASCGGGGKSETRSTTAPTSGSTSTSTPAAAGAIRAAATLPGVPPDVPKEYPLPAGATVEKFENAPQYNKKYLFLNATGSLDAYGGFYRDQLKARGWTVTQFNQGETTSGRGVNILANGFSTHLAVVLSESNRTPGSVSIEGVFEPRPGCPGANPSENCI